MFTFKLSIEADVLAFFWFGDCFGYFIRNLGEFSPNLLVALLGIGKKLNETVPSEELFLLFS
jgi:hypothetical protein